MWSQCEQLEHWTAVDVKIPLHMIQYQVLGPGFCSIPARMRSSRIRLAGDVLFLVKHIKNPF